MNKRILLTSFDTWLPHQQSNSSDDLLSVVIDFLPHSHTLLRRMPVDISVASIMVTEKIKSYQPDAIVCCGMAESRTQLSIESNATCGEILQTAVDLEKLVSDTAIEISHDCGKFVCEGLYYAVLAYLRDRQPTTHCIFVHVPTLNSENLPKIMADFMLIVQRLALF